MLMHQIYYLRSITHPCLHRRRQTHLLICRHSRLNFEIFSVKIPTDCLAPFRMSRPSSKGAVGSKLPSPPASSSLTPRNFVPTSSTAKLTSKKSHTLLSPTERYTMPNLKTVRSLYIAAIIILAFVAPDLIISASNSLALYCHYLLQAVADSLDFHEESLLIRTATLVLLNLTGLLRHIMQILQKADRITTAAGDRAGQDFHPANRVQSGGDAFPFLHKVFQGMMERVGILMISVNSLDAPSLIRQLALQLRNIAGQALLAIKLAMLFQSIVQKAMATVVGHLAAARLIAYANIVLFALQYRLGRIFLGLCVWSLGLLNI